MAKIAFILLCHKDPEAIIKQAQRLTAKDDYMSIHFDARAPQEDYLRIRDALKDNARVTFASRRKRCGWGEWSLVEATLLATEAALAAFPDASHFYMLSGDCMPIKSAEYSHDFLDETDADFIESFDFFESDWIKTGIQAERLIYRHYFNERQNKRLFYAAMTLQKRLGLERKVPSDLQIMIGSQWWCLRRRTIEAILAFTRQRRDVMRFFRTTWIPDETFFQTLVRHLVPEQEIENRTLTFLLFSDYGMPVTFYNDHYDLLMSQDYLFARKISPEAHELKRRLGVLYASDGAEFPVSNEGRRLFEFLTGRGRDGRRFAPRFWENDGALGQDRSLLIVVCKKWHVAKRLVARIQKLTNIPAVEYLFNEESCALPDLGGIQTSMDKRHRHRRALMRMLFDYYDSDRLLICLDPANLDLMQDFYGDRAGTRLLEVQCSFTDAYLVGHAKRTGLAGDHTKPEALRRLLPTLHNDVLFESEAIREAALPNHAQIRQTDAPEHNARSLADFLQVPLDTAQQIARTDHLFAD